MFDTCFCKTCTVRQSLCIENFVVPVPHTHAVLPDFATLKILTATHSRIVRDNQAYRIFLDRSRAKQFRNGSNHLVIFIGEKVNLG